MPDTNPNASPPAEGQLATNDIQPEGSASASFVNGWPGEVRNVTAEYSVPSAYYQVVKSYPSVAQGASAPLFDAPIFLVAVTIDSVHTRIPASCLWSISFEDLTGTTWRVVGLTNNLQLRDIGEKVTLDVGLDDNCWGQFSVHAPSGWSGTPLGTV